MYEKAFNYDSSIYYSKSLFNNTDWQPKDEYNMVNQCQIIYDMTMVMVVNKSGNCA